MSVGVLAHLFGCLPYRDLASKTASYGFKHVQLAPWKAIADVDFREPGRLSPGLAMSIGEAFDRHGVRISVLGCYVHLYERDEAKRRVNIERFKELLRHARHFGAPMVAAETGVNPGFDYTDEDWAAMRRTLEELTEEAERWGAIVALEPANGHLIGTADALRRMLDEVPSPHVGVVLDPGNLLHEGNFERQNEVIEEAFALLGPRIVAAHAKDRVMENGQAGTVSPGRGRMNYELFLRRLEACKPGVDIVLEATAESDMPRAKSFLEATRLGAKAMRE